MRIVSVIFLLEFCTLLHAESNKRNEIYATKEVKELLQLQIDLLRLFKHVLQPNFNKDQAEIAKNYKIEENMAMYKHQKYVEDFLYNYKQGMLPRGKLFTVSYQVHRNQIKSLIQLLYFAKDLNTFYKTACWARQHINEGMFIHAMYFTVFHRQDTQKLFLPPIYEVYPHLFVNSEIIENAYKYKMIYRANNTENKYLYVNGNGISTLGNYPEQYDLKYFTEDIGLNANYFYYNMDYPMWLGSEEFGLNKNCRGEQFYFVHQQLLAHYYLERLSNGYGNIPMFDWNEPIKSGFKSLLRYPNGLEIPSRPPNAHVVYNPYDEQFRSSWTDNQFEVQEVQDYERRIRDAIDVGFIYSKEGKLISLFDENGFNILGNIIQSNPDSINDRFYGYLEIMAKQILGYTTQTGQLYPSALENFETALRDPLFYQFYKRLIYYFMKYKLHLSEYKTNELNYPGIKIESVLVDELITYFEEFRFEITNALSISEQEFEQDNFHVWTSQNRLNHKPFTYKINVHSDKATNVVVRVFLGPKYDRQGQEVPLNDNRVNFIELDKFVSSLQAGDNIIERNSEKDYLRNNYTQVLNSLKRSGYLPMQLVMSESHGFPKRLILPKGKVEGQVFQLYVHIGPYTNKTKQYDPFIFDGIGSNIQYIDDLPFGYPLDRQIKSISDFFVPNSNIQDIVIYHKNNPIDK